MQIPGIEKQIPGIRQKKTPRTGDRGVWLKNLIADSKMQIPGIWKQIPGIGKSRNRGLITNRYREF
jgi:hypothetical protein